MNVEEFRDYCLAKKGVTETFPFDEVTLVFKVMGKKHWNTVYLDQLSPKLLTELIDHSYDLVVSKFTKKLKAEFEAM